MTINIGNKQIGKLYKGDERIVEMYKGEDLIFEDFELKYGFKFTIDTRLTTTNVISNNDATFNFKTYSLPSGLKMKIIWGDGTEQNYTGPNQVSHRYPTPGEYQVTLVPTERAASGGIAEGWMSTIFRTGSSNHKIKSIDTPIPPKAVRFRVSTSDSGGTDQKGWYTTSLISAFDNLRHVESVPATLLDNVEIEYSQTPGSNAYVRMFEYTFRNAGLYTQADFYTPFKKFLERIDFTPARQFGGTFRGTFFNAPLGIVNPPARLFTINAPNAENFSYMFERTFATDNGYPTRTHGAVVLPNELFYLVGSEGGTDFSDMFSNTFNRYLTVSGPTSGNIPENLIVGLGTSNGTNFQHMFLNTFSRYGERFHNISIPEDLFAWLDTSNGTKFEQMFSGTFAYLSSMDVGTIPENLFNRLNTSKGTNFRAMFSSTFISLAQSYDNRTTPLPERLFDIDTSRGTTFQEMFLNTFNTAYRDNQYRSVPSLFKYLDTSNGTNFEAMFKGTFHYAFERGSHTFADNLFSELDTSNGTNFKEMFRDTFGSVAFSTNTSLPATFFGINTQNGIYFTSMFRDVLSYSNMYLEQIPEGIFTFDTRNGVDFSNMFRGAFVRLSTNGAYTLKKYFNVDTSNGTDLYNMFSYTFAQIGYSSFSLHPISIPSDLFSFLDVSNATNMSYIFQNVFGFNVAEVPEGLLGHLSIPQGANLAGMFERMFTIYNSETSEVLLTPLKDVFLGMSDFSWANNSNAAIVFTRMFAAPDSTSKRGNIFTGQANTILQHFNFVPDADTNMFINQDQLTDYNTINANWK